MLNSRKFFPLIISYPRLTYTISKRQVSLVAENTLLSTNIEYHDLKVILYFHNKYLRNLKNGENIDIQTFQFYQKLMHKNPKLFQHFMSVAYPKALYSVSDLRDFYPKINIDGGKGDLLVTEDVITAATAGAIMKKQPLFAEGILTVLACEYDPINKKKSPTNPLALKQTKQEHPDYLYTYRPIDKKMGIWSRFYDFKGGKINVNTGHIFATSDVKQYEEQVRQMLNGQKRCYEEISDIRKFYNTVLENKTLTWSQRNYQIHDFFKNNLQKYPNINPSFILYHPLLYEIENQTIPRKFSGFVTSHSVSNIENTKIMIANHIILGGKECQENYLNHPYGCPDICEKILL